MMQLPAWRERIQVEIDAKFALAPGRAMVRGWVR
jgi:hypothetical protein